MCHTQSGSILEIWTPMSTEPTFSPEELLLAMTIKCPCCSVAAGARCIARVLNAKIRHKCHDRKPGQELSLDMVHEVRYDAACRKYV